MILRQMPPIHQEPFRSWFYRHWGRENCVVAARTRRADYPLFEQRLSIKAAWGGSEDYFIDGRRVAVNDDSFIILNDGRTYASSLKSRAPVTSFAIFFRPGMAEEVQSAHALGPERLLDAPQEAERGSAEFSERLRPHDRFITPVLRFIHRQIEAGLSDEQWLEEQLYFLLERMHVLRGNDLQAERLLPMQRASTRREIFRRLGCCVDFMHTHYARHIGLADIAGAAPLSPYHCLRLFKALHGITPATYLNNLRVRVAERLLRSGSISVDQAAARVGFESRTTLFRHMKRVRGCAPSTLRPDADGADRAPMP
ncbi:MAG: helix-turn-helix transcriptional regulator [Gammaproteobacteria bacterium]|nr:helix-turn-helix transcriptional regulator [Gammaproteobacteria bacterium]